MPPGIGANIWLVIAVVIAVTLLSGLLFLLVGSVMEFVLVESLRREEVTIRQYWSQRWRQGARLFGFRPVIGLLVVGSAAVVAVLVLLIPFGILGALGFFVLAVAESFGIGILVVVGLLFGLPVLVVIALALLVLGDIERDLDLIPEQRAAVRAEEGYR